MLSDKDIADAFKGMRERVYVKQGGTYKEWPCGCVNSDDGRGQKTTRYCLWNMLPVFKQGEPHPCARREEERGDRY